VRHLLKSERNQKHGRIYMQSERFSVGAEPLPKEPALDAGESGAGADRAGADIALNVAIVIKIPKGFFPQQDTGALQAAIRGPQDASFRR
jgi:multidrug efflux pump